MARKKKETAIMESNGEHTQTTAVVEAAEPVPQAIPVTEEQPVVAPDEQPTNRLRDPRKPEVSYRCSTDKTTSIEVSVWANQMTSGSGETWTQYSITVTRSYRDLNQQWCKGGSYRAHDVPVLLFLLNKAHGYCLNSRTDDSSMPF